MEQDKPLEAQIRDQFTKCEDDEGWWRCKTCGGKFYYGDSRKSDLLRHLDSHE